MRHGSFEKKLKQKPRRGDGTIVVAVRLTGDTALKALAIANEEQRPLGQMVGMLLEQAIAIRKPG